MILIDAFVCGGIASITMTYFLVLKPALDINKVSALFYVVYSTAFLAMVFVIYPLMIFTVLADTKTVRKDVAENIRQIKYTL